MAMSIAAIAIADSCSKADRLTCPAKPAHQTLPLVAIQVIARPN